MDRCFNYPSGSIRTKSDLMKYALEHTYKRDSHGDFAGFNFADALDLYEFYLAHVPLPDVEVSAEENVAKRIGDFLSIMKPDPAPTAND